MVLYNFFLSNQMTHEALFKDFICVLLKRMKDGNEWEKFSVAATTTMITF